jgi:hypothetical protein
MSDYDRWKTRSDRDELERSAPIARCDDCGGPLGEHPWATWSSDGENALLCDQCAHRRERGGNPCR